MPFRYQGKSIFLTYSQCDLEPALVLDVLKLRVGTAVHNELSKACIGQELHSDGGKHLHICAWYTKQLNFSDVRYLDIEGFHPNIRGTKIENKRAAIKYCSKECPPDRMVQYNMDIKEETAAREGHRKILGKRMMTEKLVDIIEDAPELMFDYTRLQKNILAYHNDKKREEKLARPAQLYTTLKDEDGDNHILELAEDPKKRHHWIYSDKPNKGKTTFLEGLEDKYRAHFYNTDEKYQEFNIDTQFVLFDAYRQGPTLLPWGRLEKMCDGTYAYPTKGGNQIRLQKPTIIICSNMPPSVVYPNCMEYLEARFITTELK